MRKLQHKWKHPHTSGENATLAKDLQLTQALEWVAKAYGFNTYAALQASKNPFDQLRPTAKLFDLIEQDYSADRLFLKTIDSYLRTDFGKIHHVPVYAEPTPLLFAVIENWYANCEVEIFFNLMVINAIGIKVYRNKHDLGQLEQSYLDASPVGGLAKYVLRYTEINNHENTSIDVDWEIYLYGKWEELTLNHISRDINYPNAEFKLSDLAKALNAKRIVNAEIESQLLQHQNDFLDESKELYREYHGSYYDQPYSEGMYTHYHLNPTPTKLKEIGNGCVEIQDYVSFDITYEDQDGKTKYFVESLEMITSLYMTDKGFRFAPEFAMEGKNSELNQLAFDAYKKLWEKHQYLLANIWIANGASFTRAGNEQNRIERLKLEIEDDLESSENELWIHIQQNIADYLSQDLLDILYADCKLFDEVHEHGKWMTAFYKGLDQPQVRQRLRAVMHEQKELKRAELYQKHHLV